MQRAAAALAEFRSQGLAAQSCLRRVLGEQRPGFSQGAPFKRAAADRAAESTVGHDDQPRTNLARCRALDGRYRHHGAAAMLLQPLFNRHPHFHGPRLLAATTLTARMIVSGVAGASSSGTTPGARLAMASVMAENTETASMSGGSPTALER